MGCWSGKELPVALRAVIAAQWPDEVDQAQVYCDEPGGHSGQHRACLVSLDPAGSAARALWAQWSDETAPQLVVLDDCTSLSPSRVDACARYHRHEGPYTWEQMRDVEVTAR